MEARLQALANVIAGTVRVATVHSIGLYELSAQIKRYLKAYPQVHLHLAYSRSSRIYEDVLKGNVDIGVVAYPSRRSGVTVLPFRNDRLVLACPPHHPLAGHRRVSIRKLAGEPLVGYERDIPTRRETDRLLRRYGAALCEDVWACARPPGGRFDRIGLHRLALCENATGPIVLYLPGMHMNGELPIAEPRHDLRVYLAAAGVRTWGLDYRTHAVPADAPAADLEALSRWTANLFVDDAAWAAAFV